MGWGVGYIKFLHASEAARLTLGKHTVIYLFIAGALDITVRSKNTC